MNDKSFRFVCDILQFYLICKIHNCKKIYLNFFKHHSKNEKKQNEHTHFIINM